MPRGHGRTFGVSEKIADRRSFALSRRSSEQRSRNFPSKENLVVVPVLRNCEESKRVVLKFITLDVHLWRLLAPFTSFVQGPESRNEQGSQNSVNTDLADGPDLSYLHPTVFIQFDLQKDRSQISRENPAFTSAAPKSSLLNYNSDCIASNTSTDAINEPDKPAKQSSRKKGKKKRKQYKRSTHKKALIKPENHSEEVNCDASKSVPSSGGDLVCSAVSENNSFLVVDPLSLPVHDASSEVADQLNVEINGGDCSGGLSSSEGETCEKRIDYREPVSLPHEFNDDNDEHKMPFWVATSSSNYSCETGLSTSSRNNSEIDMTENSLNDCSTERSNANDDEFNSLADRNVSVQGECSDCSSERLLGSSQASSSDGFHPVIRAKRGRLARKFSASSNGIHRLNGAYLHRRSETFDRHSMWKKVEKARTPELTPQRNNGKIFSQNANISINCMERGVRQVSEMKQNRTGKSFQYSSFNEMDSPRSYSSILTSVTGSNSDHLSMNGSTFLKKLQRKPDIASERASQYACHTNINNINMPLKIQVPRKGNLGSSEEFSNAPQLTDRTNSSTASTMILQKNLPQNTSLMSQEIPPNSSIIKSNLGQTSVDINKDFCIHTSKEDIQCKRVETESAHPKICQTDSQTDDQDEPAQCSSNSSVTDELLSSNPCSFDYLPPRKTQCSSPSSGYMDCSSPEEDELISKVDSQPCTSSEESSDFPSPSGCRFSHETKEELVPGLESDLMKIIKAVDGSFQLSTGSPIAGFERVLHSATPFIETGCIGMCFTCSQNQINGDSLYSYQVPNFSLSRLWQWYEKPGSYGLEVMVDELSTSKRSRNGFSKFFAYFVPYLSAIQLFAQSGKSNCHPSNDNEAGLMRTCEACGSSKYSSSLTALPILSKLLPQSMKKDSSLEKDEEFVKVGFGEQSTNELIFEYFDSDQPQQRRPLFDKVQELIRGDSSSNSHFFGNPSKLGCLRLKELHPASWYAVAWYPIYRIPDGNFRAAFLTYHSFGRFVRRSASNSANGCVNSLSLPVVGLQSYNAQGECWFEPANLNSRAVQTNSTAFKCPSEYFKDRLQSLERTACAMSRATVHKGNLSCMNRHPDFEFFLSRRR